MVLLWPEPVSHPRLGEDVARRIFRFDFFSELIDKDAQVLRLLNALWPPDGLQQHAMGQHLFRMPRHINQQVEFFWGEMYLFSGYGNDSGLQVDMKITNLDGLR